MQTFFNFVPPYTWTNASPGNFATGSNWSGGTAPNVTDVVAIVATNPNNAGNFTLNSSMTLGKLDYSNPQSRSITGSGTLNFAVSSGNPEISVTGGQLTISTTISGSQGISKTGAGKLILTGSSNYGGNRIVEGTLSGNSVGNTGNGSAFGSGNFFISGGATLEYTGPSTATNRFVNLLDGNGTVSVTNAATELELTRAVQNNGGLIKAGAGTLKLSSTTNSYAGSTTIDDGILKLGSSEVIPNTSSVIIAAGKNFDLNNFAETIGSLAGAGNVTLGSGSLTAGGNNSSTSFSGVISGIGGVTKQGSGIMTLTGSNSYSGGTLVNGGTLVVNNTTGSGTGSGSVTVNNSGKLAGSGWVAGSVIINNGGTLAPGNSIESLDVGALTFNTGATFDVELDTNASLTAAADLVNANGNLGIFAGAILALADLGNTLLANGTKITLLSYAGAWNGGTFDGYADDSLVTVGVNQYMLNYNDTSGSQNFGGAEYANYMTLTTANTAAVPEASSFLFAGIVCTALATAHFGRKLLRRRVAVPCSRVTLRRR
jgi:autotransporter-associated beta strand protein